jgi:hypothetical protein
MERKNTGDGDFVGSRGIWGKMILPRFLPGFLEPGTELLEPFGQKEFRSPGDFFSWKSDLENLLE